MAIYDVDPGAGGARRIRQFHENLRQHLRANRQGSKKASVFSRCADGQRWTEDEAVHITTERSGERFSDHGVGVERQVWTVLFDRSMGDDENRAWINLRTLEGRKGALPHLTRPRDAPVWVSSGRREDEG